MAVVSTNPLGRNGHTLGHPTSLRGDLRIRVARIEHGFRQVVEAKHVSRERAGAKLLGHVQRGKRIDDIAAMLDEREARAVSLR
ncbi:hypothetical protein, partial [Escherichia coli]